MNTLVLYMQLILCFPVQNDRQCKLQFFEAAVKDTSFGGMVFLKLTVIDSVGADEHILISNQSLYLLLKKRSHLNYDSYKELMKNVLIFNYKIPYAYSGSLAGFIHPKRNDFVERIARRGRDKLIKRFFKNGVFQWGKYENHFIPVVAKLFEMNVLVSLVENGAFAITYKADCK